MRAQSATTERASGSEHSWFTPKLLIVALCCTLAFVGLSALGVWQLERRVWKLDLIAHVTQRVHAAPVAAPGLKDWTSINRANAEYRHVRVSGHFLNTQETLVRAATAFGSGYWVLTPLKTDDGFVVLVNRGFVPAERKAASSRQDSRIEGGIVVTGLLRITEPKGGFMRDNDAQHDRWYSRDVAPIAQARGLDATRTAPYFIDADATSEQAASDAAPIAGLTVVSFYNNHLSYAITWFALAMMPAAFLLITIRRERRLRRVLSQPAINSWPNESNSRK